MTVYKHYSQEQLNDQYNVRKFVPDYADYFERWEKQSEHLRKTHTHHKNIFYGKHPQECLDIFPAENSNGKTIVFIHGGYWHLLDKELFHFLALPFLNRNVNIALINYPLAPGASMDLIVSSCHRAIQWLHDNIIRYKGDPAEMYVMGHSAGAHLAAMLLAAEHTNFIKAIISLSGLFRLEPIMLSYLNSILSMNIETAEKNSPVFIKMQVRCPIILAIGTKETEEFQDQSLEFYKSRRPEHRAIELLTLKNRNHYSILEEMTERDSVLLPAIFRMMDVG